MKNLPEKIYLNFGDMTKDEFEKEDYNALTQQDEYAVTFCVDKVFDTDVVYLRRDFVVDNLLDLEQNSVEVERKYGEGGRELYLKMLGVVRMFEED